MKGKLGIFLAGMIAGFLLDPASGEKRRAKVAERLEPVRRRLIRVKDQVAHSDTVQSASDTVQHAAGSVQSSAADAMSRVAEQVQGRIHQVQERFGDVAGMVGVKRPESTATQAPASSTNGRSAAMGGSSPDTAASARAEVTPRNVIDPIPEGTPNDPTLAARVESELFRDQSIPKGEVSLDAVDGVVTLRGTVDPKVADKLLERTRAVDGVREAVDKLQRG
jgi:osmotically-inducible protein OsmY